MSWIPLAERFSALPLILSGPILRRTEPRAVTVWLALKEPRTVTLRIYGRDNEGEFFERFAGTRRTVRLGDHLHVVAVTAHAPTDEGKLAWGGLYYYNLFFQKDAAGDRVPDTAPHLYTAGVLTLDPASADFLQRLVYPGNPLPSFALPPEDLNRFRILHGSCRKPHGIGKEMLYALDVALAESAQEGANRPQQLFLTGNHEEILPLVDIPARLLAPGQRADAVLDKARFTTEVPECHLLSLAEFCAMYLFAWSDVLWPDDLPRSEERTSGPVIAHRSSRQATNQAQEYLTAANQLQEFRSTRAPSVSTWRPTRFPACCRPGR
jgi:hypothetical protein